MGVEIRPATINGENHSENGNIGAPVVLGLQPFALVDHIAKVDWSILSQIPGERGGSFPVLPLFFSFFWIFLIHDS